MSEKFGTQKRTQTQKKAPGQSELKDIKILFLNKKKDFIPPRIFIPIAAVKGRFNLLQALF